MMKTLHTKHTTGKISVHGKGAEKKDGSVKKAHSKKENSESYSEFEKLKMLNEFFTHPNYLDDYFA